MRSAKFACLLLPAVSLSLNSCHSQAPFGQQHLILERSIVLPRVKGRIDHLDVNLKDQIVYVAALGNNSLEIADIKNGRVLHSIKGLDEPQGVAYIPQYQEIMVSNGGNGTCGFYSTLTYEKLASVKLSSDADDVRYDSVERKIYVGYGNGGIAVIDAGSHKQVGDIKLPGHPEGFQLDKAINRLFVNVPDAGMIAVIDLHQEKLIAQWKNEGSANFPMAIDTMSHLIIVGYRRPPQFVVLDGTTGRKIEEGKTVSDMDDLYFNGSSKEIFVSGGGGYIQVFRQEQNGYRQIAHITTRNGARTSLLIPQAGLFVLAERAAGSKEAALLVYKTQP